MTAFCNDFIFVLNLKALFCTVLELNLLEKQNSRQKLFEKSCGKQKEELKLEKEDRKTKCLVLEIL